MSRMPAGLVPGGAAAAPSAGDTVAEGLPVPGTPVFEGVQRRPLFASPIPSDASRVLIWMC
jgi:hypothetical protein